jgi:hypothetical protein
MPEAENDHDRWLDTVGSTVLMRAWEIGPPDTVYDGWPETLWHYTDAGGALGVLQSEELWATHALFMNDASELKLARTRLTHVLASAELTTQLADAEARELFENALNLRLDALDGELQIYVVCFCSHGDDLAQWREYGRQGGGFALGFEGAGIARLTEAQLTLELFPVLYDEREQLAAAGALVRAALDTIAAVPADDRELWLRAVERSASALGILAQRFAYRIKHPTFAAEREWRLMYRPPAFPPDEEDAMLYEDLPRFHHAVEQKLRPHVRIPIGRFYNNTCREPRGMPLTHVRIGPTAHPETSRLGIEYALADQGIDAEISRSEIPLRG